MDEPFLSDQERYPLFRPPAPEPRYIPANARTTPLGYLRYFQIMARNPLEVWTTTHFEQLSVSGQLFGKQFLLLHDPEGIRHYMVTNAANYGLTYITKALFEPILGSGLLVAEGDLWKRTRRSLTPVFTARHVQGFAPAMMAVAEKRAQEFCTKSGSVIGVSREMLTLTLDVLIECLFSGDTSLDSKKFSANLDRLLAVAGAPHPFDLIEAPQWVPRVGRTDALNIVADLRRQVSRLLLDRRKRTGEGKAIPNDLLSLLLSAGLDDGEPLTDDEVIDNLLTLLSAGHETTARTLTWAFYLLSKSPQHLTAVLAEIQRADLDTIAPHHWQLSLPYITAALKETMRLYPAAPVLTRMALCDDRIGDIEVKKGTQVVSSSWVLHRHPKLWRDPDVFDPRRFLDSNAAAIPRHGYAPFGMGPRVCIGASFSMQEMVIILATFLRKMKLTHVGTKDPMPIMRVTIQPSTPVNMKITAF